MTTPDSSIRSQSEQAEMALATWSVDSTSDLLVRLARETTVAGLMHRILKEARLLTGAEGGTFTSWMRARTLRNWSSRPSTIPCSGWKAGTRIS